jgi:hypothetical protein
LQEINVEDLEDIQRLDGPIGPPIFNAVGCVLTVANPPKRGVGETPQPLVACNSQFGIERCAWASRMHEASRVE